MDQLHNVSGGERHQAVQEHGLQLCVPGVGLFDDAERERRFFKTDLQCQGGKIEEN